MGSARHPGGHRITFLKAATSSVIPDNENQRMAAVRRYDILDTPPDGAFDRVTAIAARRFDVPIAIISIVDRDRIWFKSHHGLSVEQIDREPGLCASAILSPDPHILADASVDPRSLTNPLVAGDFGLRFYAGVPLTTSDGFNLGTLCVIDKTPRTINDDQIEDLKDLASVVMDQMELRLSARNAVARADILAREIDHRVMNSLQFVSSMLALQSRGNDLTDATAEQLKIAASRVASVVRVHRHFQSDEAAESTSCITFLRRMCADLSDIVGKPIAVSGDEGEVPTTRIQPIGLIVNELVTNAAKHGEGQIEVIYRIMSDTHEISVCDEGSGPRLSCVPPGGGLGTKVVAALASQLRGAIKAGRSHSGSGSCFTVTFPV